MPQVRLPFLLALFAAAAAALVFSLTHRTTAQRQAAYNRAVAELTARRLPSGFTAATGCGGTVCADSPLMPHRVLNRVRSSVAGGKLFGTNLACPAVMAEKPGCPVSYLGRFHGYKELAIVIARMLPQGTTHPPAGAVSIGHGSHRLWFSGSQLTYELVAPNVVNG